MKQVGPAEVSGTGWWYKSCLYPTDPASLPGVRLWFGPILRKPLALRVPPPSSPLAAARARLGRWGCLGPYPRGSLRRTSAVAFLSLLYSKRRGKESVSEYYGAVVGCGGVTRPRGYFRSPALGLLGHVTERRECLLPPRERPLTVPPAGVDSCIPKPFPKGLGEPRGPRTLFDP